MTKQFYDSVPFELIDSKVFVFDITLPSVFNKTCEPCRLVLEDELNSCPKCGSTNLKRSNRVVRVDIKSNVKIDYDSVEYSLQNIPSELSFWSAVYAEMKYRENICERVVKSVRSKVYDQILEASRSEGVKLSLESIKTLIEKDERINNSEIELAKAHMISSKLYYMVEAIKMKADLSRTLTSLKRSEYSAT
jgi:hypothetical protein